VTAVDNRVVLISGGSRGLGLAIVEDCLRNDWCVVTFSRSKTPRMSHLEGDFPGRLLHFCGDLADPQFPATAVERAKAEFGGLDALINNAAMAFDGVLATIPPASIHELVQVNLTSTLLMSRAAVREFLRTPLSRPKWILNISSIVGLTGFRGLSVYGSTKAALLGLTRSLARELGPANIVVNAVLPGFLATDMSSSLESRKREQIVRRTPLGRLGEAADVVPVVRFLLSPESRFITGQYIVVDGGATC
jgi:3-oxoacyl-[acyl-carrier protein] reductase